ncbi:uncharacterized protein LOC120633906 isoform X2 [Pararge aegeria]|uniref:uncharacterized protein LOC120633906 isoform X2 n=1 Tax=Pararge aegeria TaxID=116150 RepID=UPI0019CFE0F1|nr:uncharacterized protein LOC120633906 isoform X2 [Pararge aegeria]
MRGGLVGSVCFLAFLLSSGIKGQNVLNSQDLQEAKSNAAVAGEQKSSDNKDKTSVEDEEKSGFASYTGSGTHGNAARPNWSVPQNYGPNTLSQANAQASANAQALGSMGGIMGGQMGGHMGVQNPVYGYGYPGSNAASTFSEAKALVHAGGGTPYGHSGWRSDVEVESDGVADSAARNEQDDNDASDADASSRTGVGYNYGAFSGAVSRLVPQNEYVHPDLVPGGQSVITCTREYEIHTIWSPAFQCLVCVCVRDGWTLRAACVSCSTCATKPEPKPPVHTIPFPPPPPLVPESQVSCSPLPTNTPFENPLNPCQTCICNKVVNVYGQEDVQIKCEENPSCVTPPEFIPIPPLPTPPRPVPMPLCDSLPPNVPFPHPTENCTICKCVEETTYLLTEKRMICQPDPLCHPRREEMTQPPPVPEFPIMPYPPTPSPTPSPPLIPDHTQRPTEIDPIPWPPIVQPLPRPPSPLPGPPPHDTCRPYPPNTPFQHPWDECQICVCSEIYGNNVVNIEVNCYTKKSCCIEPPIPEPLGLPYKPAPSPGILGPPLDGNLIFIEPTCRYRPPNQPYVMDCNICTCETVYKYVYAKCTPQPNCGNYGQVSPYGQIGSMLGSSASAAAMAQSNLNSQASADAAAIANAQQQGYQSLASSASQALSQANGYGSSSADAVSNAISEYNQGQASSSALANAIANSNQYPYSGVPPSSSYSSAEATANAQAGNLNLSPYSNSLLYSPLGGQLNADAIANSQTGNMNLSPFGNSYPYSPGSAPSSAQAQAEAIANSQTGNMNLSPLGNSYPYSLGSAQSSSQAQAEAIANSQTGNMNLSPLGNSYPYSLGSAQSSSQAQAEAIANSQTGNMNLSPLGNSYPYSLGSAQSSSQADAIANSQTSLLSPYGNYPYAQSGGQSSAQTQAEALTQSSNLSPYGIYGQGQSSAQAQAESQAQSGGVYPYGYPYSPGSGQSNVQADALANAQTISTSPYGSYPYYPGQSSAQAQAGAMANAQSQTLGSPYGVNPYLGGSQSSAQAQSDAVAASQMYPSLYPNPINNIESLYQPGMNGWDAAGQSALVQGQAQADVQTSLYGGSSVGTQSQAMTQGSETAQSLAQAASMSGRPLIKSGKGLCKYAGDKYHHNCQACYCLAEASGKIYTLCLGNPCA